MTGQSDKKTKRQKALLRRLVEAKERLAISIEGLGEGVICQEPVPDDWTSKDILGHIVSWNEEFRANIAMILTGEHPGYDHEITPTGTLPCYERAEAARFTNFRPGPSKVRRKDIQQVM